MTLSKEHFTLASNGTLIRCAVQYHEMLDLLDDEGIPRGHDGLEDIEVQFDAIITELRTRGIDFHQVIGVHQLDGLRKRGSA